MATLNEGDAAPDFTAQTAKGSEVKLSQFQGQNVVLYFYPKDDTPGCTTEAKEFTEATAKFANANTVVWGVSADDVACHQAFIEKYGLKIELLADTAQKIAQAYGANGEKYANRDTFLIDKTGTIKKIYRNVKPQGHAEQILKDLQSDGRITNVKLAQNAGISAPPCLSMATRLYTAGSYKSCTR